jgi:hypothetical protein
MRYMRWIYLANALMSLSKSRRRRDECVEVEEESDANLNALLAMTCSRAAIRVLDRIHSPRT